MQDTHRHLCLHLCLFLVSYLPHSLCSVVSFRDHPLFGAQHGSAMLTRMHAGGYCLTGSKDRSVRLWNPLKSLQINTYRGNGGDVRGLAVSQDNRTFLSCGTDRLVNHFDVATGSVLRRFSGHDAAVNAVSFACEESLAISTSYDATVRFWDMKGRNSRPIDMVKVATDSVTGLAVPSAAPFVVASSVDGTIATLDIRKGALVKDDMNVPVTTVAVPEDALYIVAACTDSAVRLLDRAKGSVIGTYEGHKHKDFQIECGLICHDSVAVCGSEDGACILCLVQVWVVTCLPSPVVGLLYTLSQSMDLMQCRPK